MHRDAGVRRDGGLGDRSWERSVVLGKEHEWPRARPPIEDIIHTWRGPFGGEVLECGSPFWSAGVLSRFHTTRRNNIPTRLGLHGRKGRCHPWPERPAPEQETAVSGKTIARSSRFSEHPVSGLLFPFPLFLRAGCPRAQGWQSTNNRSWVTNHVPWCAVTTMSPGKWAQLTRRLGVVVSCRVS